MASPNEYVPGQIVVLNDAITNTVTLTATNDPTDAVTVYLPDGTTAIPAVTAGITGAYSAQYTIPAVAGWYEYVFKSTTTGAGAGKGKFWVPPVP